jgi:oligopeptide/dipeptide ABC transporter ATP-binding protein
VALLEVDELYLHYATPKGPVRAVDGASFRLEEPGEALGIIGESGSGKSSLALALMRLLPKNVSLYKGRVVFQGQDLMRLSDREFRRQVRWKGMAMVFQGAMHALNPVLKVGVQVAERLLLEGVDKRQAYREVARLLERVGLSAEIIDRYPHELSGGMKQRVMIAMALALKPPLLILDEPTSALDVSIQAQIMNLLKELKWDLGISMLFITHDLALASDICDRIAVVYGGESREYGTVDEVLLSPLDPYTQGLLASIPKLHADERPAFLTGAPPDLARPPVGCRFHPRCPHRFEPCDKKPPPLFEVEPGHLARCWLYGREA